MKHFGRVKPVPNGLINTGPCVAVILSPGEVSAQALLANGKTVPAVSALLMIDTGAQLTCIDQALATGMGLRPMRFSPVVGVSGVANDFPVYRMGITIAMADASGTQMQICYSADVVGMPTPSQHSQHRGLLGRDFLRHFKLIYDGSRGEFELGLAVALAGSPNTPSASPQKTLPLSHGSHTTPEDRRTRRKRERDARKKNR